MSQLWCSEEVTRDTSLSLHSANCLLCSSGGALGTQTRSGTAVCKAQGSSEAAPLHSFRFRAQELPRHKCIYGAGGEHRAQREEQEHDEDGGGALFLTVPELLLCLFLSSLWFRCVSPVSGYSKHSCACAGV